MVKNYEYDPFGNEKNIDPNDGNAFRYCGEYFDRESGNYYLRARYYDPDIARFITDDSYPGKDNDPLSLNLYTYCHNNPINMIDPSGHNADYQLGLLNELLKLQRGSGKSRHQRANQIRDEIKRSYIYAFPGEIGLGTGFRDAVDRIFDRDSYIRGNSIEETIQLINICKSYNNVLNQREGEKKNLYYTDVAIVSAIVAPVISPVKALLGIKPREEPIGALSILMVHVFRKVWTL